MLTSLGKQFRRANDRVRRTTQRSDLVIGGDTRVGMSLQGPSSDHRYSVCPSDIESLKKWVAAHDQESGLVVVNPVPLSPVPGLRPKVRLRKSPWANSSGRV